MKETEVIIIGQGLSGTWLSWWLSRAGISFLVIDKPERGGASLKSAGLINPVTGRRWVKTWRIEELMPFAESAYQQMGETLNEKLISNTSVIDLFPSVQMKQAFQKSREEDPQYLIQSKDPNAYNRWFSYDLGWGAIRPCLLTDVELLLGKWRYELKKTDRLREEIFDPQYLKFQSGGVEYTDTRSRYIVFCDGTGSAGSSWFGRLPFAPNKGEGLLVEIPDLPPGEVYKKGMSLVPFRKNIFWLGSSYEWSFDDSQPTEQFRKGVELWLQKTLKIPFKVLDHFAAVRPATLERRPFVGFHPHYPSVGILNGMGTKGCSLAPFFAAQLADEIAGKGKVDAEVSVSRFERILKP